MHLRKVFARNCDFSESFQPFKRQTHKMVKHTHIANKLFECFYYFVELAFRRLYYRLLTTSFSPSAPSCASSTSSSDAVKNWKHSSSDITPWIKKND